MTGPEPTELIQPVIHLLEWLWLQAIETALCVHRGFDETGVAQHAQVLGDGRLRHPQPARDPEPPGPVPTVGGRDRAPAADAAADRLQAPARAARRRFRRIHGGRTAPSLSLEARATPGGG